MKNSEAQIRIHRYGIMKIYSISYVKGSDVKAFQNVFTIKVRGQVFEFNSKAQAKECISAHINSAPAEFKSDFIEYRYIFNDVI